MSRWEPNARDRLQEAALQLYLERGFEQTTVADIADRAGLTERTYFRHFADKREALFGGQAMLTERMLTAIADAPADATPRDLVGAALTALGPAFDGQRDHALRRQTVIDANPALQERELIKLATLSTEIAEALRRRGVADAASGLAAETGMAVFKVAFTRWVHGSTDAGLAEMVTSTMDELKAFAG